MTEPFTDEVAWKAAVSLADEVTALRQEIERLQGKVERWREASRQDAQEIERLRAALYECVEVLRAGSAEKWRTREAVAHAFAALATQDTPND